MSSDFLSSPIPYSDVDLRFQSRCAICNLAKVNIIYQRDAARGIGPYWTQEECPGCHKSICLQLPPTEWDQTRNKILEARDKDSNKPLTRESLQNVIINVKHSILGNDKLDKKTKEIWTIGSSLLYFALLKSDKELRDENLVTVLERMYPDKNQEEEESNEQTTTINNNKTNK